MASAVGAPTGRRLRGGCDVGSWGEGIQWWTGCPDSIARALWKQALFEKDERLIFKRFEKICLLSKQISMKTSLWDFSSL